MEEKKRGFLSNPKSKKTWTTMSVDIELKDKLEAAIIRSGKKQAFNTFLHSIVDSYLASTNRRDI